MNPHDPALQAETFLHEFVGHGIHLISIVPDGLTSGRYFGNDAAAAARWALTENAAGKGIYWTGNLSRPGQHKKPNKGDIIAGRFAHCDIDPPKDGRAFDKDAALSELLSHECPPTFVIDSGNGLQPLWRLDHAVNDKDAIEAINLGIKAHFKGGDSCHNIDRLLRLPGTTNFPNAAKRLRGCEPVPALLAHGGNAVYSTGELVRAFPPPPQDRRAAGNAGAAKPTFDNLTLLTADDLGLSGMSPIRSLIDHPVGRDRSADGLRCAGDMLRAGFSHEQIAGVLLNPVNKVSAHYLDQQDPRRAVLRTIEYASRDRDTPGSKEGGERPSIILEPGQLANIATESELALVSSGLPIYVHAEELQRPVIDEVEASKGRRTHVARFATITTDAMRDFLSRAVRFEKFNARKGNHVDADPPRDVAAVILARKGEWNFPAAAGVITTPTLRPDGSILSEEGYDPATRLILMHPPAMPALSDRPTKDEAAAALALLDDLLSEFPFVDDPSRSVALSEMITPVVRGAMTVAPLHVNRAPVAGTGKSFLADTAAAMATGQPCPTISAGADEYELEKRLGADLMRGQALVSIDNLNGELRGDFLCQMIERPLVKVRPLGTSTIVQIENKATVFATGNNLTLVGDVVRRSIMCSLDPQVERPELREFKRNPVDTVLADRGRYVAAALTVVRAYLTAGCPGELPPLASFEDWSRCVRSALVWLGRADPVETMERAREEDPELAALRRVYVTWHQALQGQPVTTGKLIEFAEHAEYGSGKLMHPELHEALEDIAGAGASGISARKLGHWLKRYKNRITAGLQLVSAYDTHSKAHQWRIRG